MGELCTLFFVKRGGTLEEIGNVVRLRFYKDRFLSATELSGLVIRDGGVSDIVGIKLFSGGRLLHYGYAEYLKAESRNGRRTVSFRSRGWSVMLTQNEPVPGMNLNVDLARLAALNVSIPNVTYESGTAQVNYIYVNERSTVWDAVTAYAKKAYDTQPYILGDNEVRVRYVSGTARTYSSGRLVSYGEISDRRTMYSKVYMADADGQYTYSQTDQAAANDGIVRERYFALDRQWLSSPTAGLQLKLEISGRRSGAQYIKLTGYSGEELFDTASAVLEDGTPISGTVGGIEAVFEKGRAVTALYFF